MRRAWLNHRVRPMSRFDSDFHLRLKFVRAVVVRWTRRTSSFVHVFERRGTARYCGCVNSCSSRLARSRLSK
jgi:hypothetical protein